MTPETPDSAVRAALDAYMDPYLGETLGAARAVHELTGDAGGYTAKIVLGYPVGGYQEELTAGLNCSVVPAALTITRYVWRGTRTLVSASTSKNGSMRVGLVNSIEPFVTR